MPKRKEPDTHKGGYSYLVREAKKRKKDLFITLEQYTSVKETGCHRCGTILAARTLGVRVKDKKLKPTYVVNNLEAICNACKAEDAEQEFDYIAYCVRKLRQRWTNTPSAVYVISKARQPDGSYQCASCKKFFPKNSMQLDHVIPVVDPATGFTTLDDFAKRLLVPGRNNLQFLCKAHHKEKTSEERKIRDATRRKNKEINNQRK